MNIISISTDPFSYLKNANLSTDSEITTIVQSSYQLAMVVVYTLLVCSILIAAAGIAISFSSKKRNDNKEKLVKNLLLIAGFFMIPFILSVFYSIFKQLI